MKLRIGEFFIPAIIASNVLLGSISVLHICIYAVQSKGCVQENDSSSSGCRYEDSTEWCGGFLYRYALTAATRAWLYMPATSLPIGAIGVLLFSRRGGVACPGLVG